MFPNHFCFEITIITIVTIILYIPKVHEHVAVEKNINNVVENKLANPHKIRENASFFFAKKLRKIIENSVWIPFRYLFTCVFESQKL